MSLIDIKAVKAAAANDFAKERTEKAKNALIKQMRVVEQAEQVLRAEKLKLADIEQQISDGTL